MIKKKKNNAQIDNSKSENIHGFCVMILIWSLFSPPPIRTRLFICTLLLFFYNEVITRYVPKLFMYVEMK